MSIIAIILLLAGTSAAQIDQQRDPALLTNWYTPHRVKATGKSSLLNASYSWKVFPAAGEKFDQSRKWLTLTIVLQSDSSEILEAAGTSGVVVADGAEFSIPTGVLALSMKPAGKTFYGEWVMTWVLSGDAPAGALAIGNSALEKMVRSIANATEVFLTLTGPTRFTVQLRSEQIRTFRELLECYDRLPARSSLN